MKRRITVYARSFCTHSDGTITPWAERRYVLEMDGSVTLLEERILVDPDEKKQSVAAMSARTAKYLSDTGL